MTHITIETALLEQLVGALERLKIEVVLSDVPPDYIESHFRKWLDNAEIALTAGRAAIDGARQKTKIPTDILPKVISDSLKDTPLGETK